MSAHHSTCTSLTPSTDARIAAAQTLGWEMLTINQSSWINTQLTNKSQDAAPAQDPSCNAAV